MTAPKTIDVVAPRDLYVPALGDEVTAGQVVAVSPELAESLGWKHAPKSKNTKPADEAPSTEDDQ